MSEHHSRTLSIGEIYELRSTNYGLSPSEELDTTYCYEVNHDRNEAALRDSMEEHSMHALKKPRKGPNDVLNENMPVASESCLKISKRPRWKQLFPNSSSEILPLAGHCMVCCSNRIYAFGGYASQFIEGQCYSRHYNTLFEFSFSRNLWSTVRLETSDGPLSPQPRRHASMVFHGQSLYIFGGFSERHEVLSDLWSFDLVKRKWTPIIARPGSFWPAARAEHSAVVYKDRMIIFGGYDGKKKLCDTVALNMRDFSWEVVSSNGGYYPNRRCKHSAVVYRNKMYVLGGFQFANDKNAAVTDLVALNLEDMTWNLELMSGSIPEGLQAHKAVVVNDSMYIFGGKIRLQNSGGNVWQSSLNDVVWCYRFDVNCWSPVKCEGASPKARQLHGACVVHTSEGKCSLIVYGGVDRLKETYYNDIWELEGIDCASKLQSCDSCESLKNLVNSEKFADLQLVVDGFRIPAHRCILYSKCDYFRKMLESDMKESVQSSIEIRGIGYSTFLKVLFYIYTGRPAYDMDYEQLIELLVAADMLGLEELHIFCMKRLEESVNVENVSSVCQLANEYNAGQLKTFCLEYIVKYFSEVVETKGFEDLLKKEASGLAREILRLHAKAVAWNHVALGSVIELTPENFDKSCIGRLCLVEFYAPWCSYCQRVESELALLSQFPDVTNVTIAKVDGSRWKLLRRRFFVSGFPSFFLVKETQVYRFLGSHRASHMRSFIVNLTDAEELPKGLFENPLSVFWKTLSRLEDMYLKSAKWTIHSGLPVYGIAWITCVLLIVMLMTVGCLLNVVGNFRASKRTHRIRKID